MHTVTVCGRFEAAHRLPHLGGKCQSLHGHSWQVEVTVSGDGLDSDGKLIRFEDLKRPIFGWVKEHLDHGTLLGYGDPLRETLADHGTKLYLFDPTPVPDGSPALTAGLEWPTVENVAVLLTRVASTFVKHIDDVAGGPWHVAAQVVETPHNRAGWGTWV